jgi:hypothetical protein
MKKFLCAVVLVVASAGISRAADTAFVELAASVSPSVLEDVVLPSPAPAVETQVPVGEEQPSTSASAGTQLDGNTIQGEYLVQMAKMPTLRIIFADNNATLIKPDPTGDFICKGTYKIAADQTLFTDFKDCGGSSFSHTMYLAGQTVESLTAGVSVPGLLKMDGDVTPGMPVGIQKVK